jgi:hypothetical protein
MRKIGYFNIVALVLMLFTMTSCDVIVGIFEAGMWVGIIGLVLVISLIFWIFGKMRGR